MIKDILLLLTGAILGYLPVIIPYVNKVFLNYRVNKRKELLKPARVYDWLIEYYTLNKSVNDLFYTDIEGDRFTIPFLIKKQWLYFEKVNITMEKQLVYSGTGVGFNINNKLINNKIKSNQKIFNEPTLYINKISLSEDRLSLDVKQCSYFEMITSISKLEEETVQAIRKKKYKNVPIRKAYLSSAEVSEKQHNVPFSVGCVVLLAFKSKNGFEVIIQRRSAKTATYGGYKSVIPSYGLSPMPRGNENLSITFYNFIKEFAEELYDYEELIQHMSAKRGDLFWFIHADEIKEIIESFKQQSSEMIFTGFGIDVLNGTNTLSYLCLLKDELLISKIKARIKGSWEVDSTDTELALEIFDIRDGNLFTEIKNKNFHFGSAFSIIRGIEYLTLIQS